MCVRVNVCVCERERERESVSIQGSVYHDGHYQGETSHQITGNMLLHCSCHTSLPAGAGREGEVNELGTLAARKLLF